VFGHGTRPYRPQSGRGHSLYANLIRQKGSMGTLVLSRQSQHAGIASGKCATVL
jgi:hypothetical protein